MSEGGTEGRFHFLFRNDKGRIGRSEWWKGMAAIAVPLALMAGGDLALSNALRSAGSRPLQSGEPLASYVYQLAFGLAVLLGAVCFYNLSAKRFCDRNYPPSLAGLAPFALLVAGAARLFLPDLNAQKFVYISIGCDVLAALVVIWSLVELGFLRAGDRSV